MARIVLGSYLFRYPLGGNVSCVLQYLLSLEDLGHEVFFVEQSGYDNSCWDPVAREMTNDPTTGIGIVSRAFDRFGVHCSWCFVDAFGHYYGMSRAAIEEVFRTADLYIEMGTNEAWAEEAGWAQATAIIDGEPGFSQMWMENRVTDGDRPVEYDFYFTVGRNVGTTRSNAPTGGVRWRPIFHPVVTRLFASSNPVPDAAFTTVMNWQSHGDVTYDGRTYGQKSIEFERFIELPRATSQELELAIGGSAPYGRLAQHGWRIVDAHAVTTTLEDYMSYIVGSAGEFSVCKEAYVALRTGWFSDRSAVYLASGRPVIQQDTGFGSHLPCGEGLFAVRGVPDAAEAFEALRRDPLRHARGARGIARELLEGTVVLGAALDEIGV